MWRPTGNKTDLLEALPRVNGLDQAGAGFELTTDLAHTPDFISHAPSRPVTAVDTTAPVHQNKNI
jgi:hypothetical protein